MTMLRFTMEDVAKAVTKLGESTQQKFFEFIDNCEMESNGSLILFKDPNCKFMVISETNNKKEGWLNFSVYENNDNSVEDRVLFSKGVLFSEGSTNHLEGGIHCNILINALTSGTVRSFVSVKELSDLSKAVKSAHQRVINYSSKKIDSMNVAKYLLTTSNTKMLVEVLSGGTVQLNSNENVDIAVHGYGADIYHLPSVGDKSLTKSLFDSVKFALANYKE